MAKKKTPDKVTLRDAFERVGRRYYRHEWIGGSEGEASSRQRHNPESFHRLSRMVDRLKLEAAGRVTPQPKAGIPSNLADRIALVKSLADQLRPDMEERTRDPTAYEMQYESWLRRQWAEKRLVHMLAEGKIKAELEALDGEDHEIKPAHWNAPESPFWYNISASTGGYRDHKRPDFGIIRIAAIEFEEQLKEIKPRRRARTAQKEITNAKHLKWIELAREMAPCAPKNREGRPSIRAIAHTIARTIQKRGCSQDSETIRAVLNDAKAQWLKR